MALSNALAVPDPYRLATDAAVASIEFELPIDTPNLTSFPPMQLLVGLVVFTALVLALLYFK